MEDLLRLGSEAFVTLAVDLKLELLEISNRNINTNSKLHQNCSIKSIFFSLVKQKADNMTRLLSDRNLLFQLRQQRAEEEGAVEIEMGVYAQNCEINRSTESFPIYYNQ